MSGTAGKVVAVIVGLILLAGIVFSIFVQDETTILMLALLSVMYALYLVRLRKKLKTEKSGKKKPESPLARRR